MPLCITLQLASSLWGQKPHSNAYGLNHNWLLGGVTLDFVCLRDYLEVVIAHCLTGSTVYDMAMTRERTNVRYKSSPWHDLLLRSEYQRLQIVTWISRLAGRFAPQSASEHNDQVIHLTLVKTCAYRPSWHLWTPTPRGSQGSMATMYLGRCAHCDKLLQEVTDDLVFVRLVLEC